MSDWPWVAVSYALTWIVLAVYAALVLRRLRRARADLDALNDPANGAMEEWKT